MRAADAVDERFWAKVIRGGDDDCWVWTGARQPGGYGIVIRQQQRLYSHRLLWELTNNQPVPVGLIVRHTCDNPPCCNPKHLLLGTHQDNMRDKAERKRGRGFPPGDPRNPQVIRPKRGEKNSNVKVTDAQVAEIRARWAAAKPNQTSLGSEYGISRSQVQRIVYGKVRSVEDAEAL